MLNYCRFWSKIRIGGRTSARLNNLIGRRLSKMDDDNIFARNGCKNTKSRKAVVGVLRKAKAPVSADEILACIKEQGETVNLSTVYRTLELLGAKGLTSKTMMNSGKARYELVGNGHRHHLICTNCSKIVPIGSCPLESIEKNIKSETRFDITGHMLELYGICPECKARN